MERSGRLARYSGIMPGCRKLDASSSSSRRSSRVEVSHYVRLRVRPSRASNDNRSAAPRFWHWALIIGAMPTVGLAIALSTLLSN